ncbi:homoserine dehydrogenase [bacterium]|nr:homoserine dehydrogenase [bacterium]
MTKIKIGLIGLGTVGSGVFKCLVNNPKAEIVQIAVKDIEKPRNIDGLDKTKLTTDVMSVAQNPDIDILIEVIGGVNPAFDIIKTALESGKHVVTANKELLAKHGSELFELAKNKNRLILYEAAIGGGIPIVMPIKTTLCGNKINKITAILNGTTNYILTKMDTENASYEETLKEAQKLGYAETDPTGDVEGLDAKYKITTLSTISFKEKIDLDKVYAEGITKIQAEDMKNANEFGYKIKLIALAQRVGEKIDVRVHPMLISKKHPLANINDVTNGVMISGHPVGDVMLSGPGAGEFPTASSVIGDVLSLVEEFDGNPLPIMQCHHEKIAQMLDISETKNKYYISINAKNNFGVIESLGRIFAHNEISISIILQKGLQSDNTANVVVITEECFENNMQSAICELEKEDCVKRINSLIRVTD